MACDETCTPGTPSVSRVVCASVVARSAHTIFVALKLLKGVRSTRPVDFPPSPLNSFGPEIAGNAGKCIRPED